MIWLTGIICFAIGLCVGAVLFNYLKSDSAKVKQLEDRLEGLRKEHEDYKQMVHTHFNTSAQLFVNLTDSYRDVYNHLASGARSLCSDEVSDQLTLFADNRDVLTSPDESASEEATFDPPRDYADRKDPDRKGHLAEDFGLNKSESSP